MQCHKACCGLCTKFHKTAHGLCVKMSENCCGLRKKGTGLHLTHVQQLEKVKSKVQAENMLFCMMLEGPRCAIDSSVKKKTARGNVRETASSWFHWALGRAQWLPKQHEALVLQHLVLFLLFG